METNLRNSVILRMLIVGILVLILLIPQMMIESLVSERQARRDSVTGEISDKWGKSQTIIGPLLVIPYIYSFKNNEGKTSWAESEIYLLPRELSVGSVLNPEIRYRSIFETVLYSSAVRLKGEFSLSYLDKLQVPRENIHWDKAMMVLGLSDLKGIRETPDFLWDGRPLEISSGVSGQGAVSSGLSAGKIMLTQTEMNHTFDISLLLNGSSDFNMVPVGENTTANVSGAWDNPSFIGEFLPAGREIGRDSFKADWKVLNLNRNYPQAFTAGLYKIDQPVFGVRFLLPIDEYQKTMRTAKYAVLFIVLTFMAFFVSEVLSYKAIHPVQYALVGFALLIFYILLLSLSEHITFGISYIISAAAVIILISLYMRNIFGDNRPAYILGGVLTVLYAFLYVIVQAQDYALLFGSFGLFAALALLMYLTRGVDWFALGKKRG
jgi:inner membrane protein